MTSPITPIQVLSQTEINEQIIESLEQHLDKSSTDNSFASYEDLSSVAQQDVQTDEGRRLLWKARKALEARGVHFKTCHRAGLKPLTSEEVLRNVGTDSRKKIASTVDRWGGTIKTIDPDKLDSKGLDQYLKSIVSHQVHEQFAVSTTQLRIEATVDAIEDPLSPKNMRLMQLAAMEKFKSLG